MNLLIFKKVQADNMDIGVISCIHSQTISMDTHIYLIAHDAKYVYLYRSQGCYDHIRIEFTTIYVICAYHH